MKKTEKVLGLFLALTLMLALLTVPALADTTTETKSYTMKVYTTETANTLICEGPLYNTASAEVSVSLPLPQNGLSVKSVEKATGTVDTNQINFYLVGKAGGAGTFTFRFSSTVTVTYAGGSDKRVVEYTLTVNAEDISKEYNYGKPVWDVKPQSGYSVAKDEDVVISYKVHDPNGADPAPDVTLIFPNGEYGTSDDDGTFTIPSGYLKDYPSGSRWGLVPKCGIYNIYSIPDAWIGEPVYFTIRNDAAAAAAIVTQQPVSASAAVGGTLTFSVTASNAAAYSWSVCDAEYGQPYGWTTVKAHAAVSGETTAAMTLKPTDTWLNGLAVYCDIKGTDGKWYSSSAADITVTASAVPKPTITTQPVGKTGVKAGTPVTLSAAASGTGTLSYQWYQTTVNDISAIKAVTSALSGAYTVPQTPGTVYYCVGVTNTVGGKESEMVYSDLVAVTYSGAPKITAQPESLDLRTGDKAIFDVTAEGDGLHYQWYYVDAGAPQKTGTDSSELIITNVRPEVHSGYDYYCVVTNAYGSVTSAKAHLTVSDTPYRFPFTDVPEGMWYYGSVKNAHQLGLVNGKTDTTYEPEANMTYAEAVKLAACMYQKYHDGEVTLANGTEKWYSTYVEYAKAHGIPADFPDYNAQITRREYVKVFYHALPASEYGKLNIRNSIPDVPSTDSAWTEIHTFYEAGILTGIDSAGSFAPDKTIRRNEVAAILSRMMDDGARVSENQ